MKKSVGKIKEYGRMASEEFRELRHSCGMSQKEWADAVGISLALVKKIETGKQACSGKTAEKIWGFMGTKGTAYQADGLDGLEEHILYDIFIEHMKKMGGKDAAIYAGKCARPLLRALYKAAGCGSADAQKKYFDFLEMFLSVMHIAASECAGMANGGKTVSNIRMELIEFVDKKIKKMKQEENILLAGGQEEDGQLNLFS